MNILNKIGNNKKKIFCISFQRTGTTSVGSFFEAHNFQVATYFTSKRNQWTQSWFDGDYETIFKSKDFVSNQVFEDDPWWCLDFYKVLFHRFPKSKFILLERDPDQWFNSMMSHSDRKTLGGTLIHSHLYGRSNELFEKYGVNWESYIENQNGLPLDDSHAEMYKDVYTSRNQSVKSYFNFHDKSRLFNYNLNEPDIWLKMADFFDVELIEKNYVVHKNKSKR